VFLFCGFDKEKEKEKKIHVSIIDQQRNLCVVVGGLLHRTKIIELAPLCLFLMHSQLSSPLLPLASLNLVCSPSWFRRRWGRRLAATQQRTIGDDVLLHHS
jgi:hypothetical protein